MTNGDTTKSKFIDELAPLAEKFKLPRNHPELLGYELLCDLCRHHPSHQDDNEIVSKIWLIGRAYAAAIERRKKHRNIGSDEFYHRVVVKSFKHSKLDERLNSLRDYTEVTEDNVLEILKVHKYLVDLIKKITGLEKRSLASKYLHFHRPELFLMYDSRAASVLRKAPKLSKSSAKIIDNSHVDSVYASFCCRALELKNLIETHVHRKLTLREFDCILIDRANQKQKKRLRAGLPR